MSRVEVRDLGEPEAVVSYPLGETSQVRLAQTVISRHVLQPGWSWEEHAEPRPERLRAVPCTRPKPGTCAVRALGTPLPAIRQPPAAPFMAG